jgi:hypothetical protein
MYNQPADEALAKLQSMANQFEQQSPDTSPFEQAVRGVIASADRLKGLLAVSDYFGKIVSLEAPCPDLPFDVPSITGTGHISVSVPLGRIVREVSRDDVAAKQLLTIYFGLLQTWVAKEYNTCITQLEHHLTTVKANSIQS